ncbi:28913_t:CDS:1, partial [Gigaspora margarita]
AVSINIKRSGNVLGSPCKDLTDDSGCQSHICRIFGNDVAKCQLTDTRPLDYECLVDDACASRKCNNGKPPAFFGNCA